MKYDSNKSAVVSNSTASNDFIKYAKILAAARGQHEQMKAIARGVPSQRLQEAIQSKAAVAPGTSTDGSWAGPLNQMATAWLASLKPFSAFDGMLNDLIKYPINVRVVLASSGAQAGPISELGTKPISEMGFGTALLEPAKVVAHVVMSTAGAIDELRRECVDRLRDAKGGCAFQRSILPK